MVAKFSYPIKKIGIIGGGQLGKMTAQVAKRMGFQVNVLDPAPECPAAQLADIHVKGNLYDANSLRQLAHLSEVLTYDIEHIDINTLTSLHEEGYTIYPSPALLAIIQDKLTQKQVLAQHHIPVPRFSQLNEFAGFPVVQKARKGGYDGKGVKVLRSSADALLEVPSFVEEFIDFEKELAVIVARTPQREVVSYPVVEMMFDERTNICEIVAAPAKLDQGLAEKARQVALQAVEVLDGVGVFGVEMFLTRKGEIFVNEIAPRPHNSGHYTIEACMTCQFEQLIRAISGLALGKTTLLKPAVMWNLLGEAGFTGTPIIEGLAEALKIDGLFFHLYGKPITRPFRKMGHVTILADDVELALANLAKVKNILKIKGTKPL